LPEVNAQNLPPQEIQAKKTVNACTRGKRMSEHAKIIPILPHRLYPSDNDPRSELDSAACRDLDSIGSQRRVVAHSRQRRNIDHGAGGSRIQRQTQNDAPGRTEHFSLNNDKTALRVKEVVHRITAVSSGIWPV